MSWFSNIIRGKHPLTPGKDPPLVRPPAGGPSTQPTPAGPENPYGFNPPHSGGNIPQTTIPTVGVNAPHSGGSMTGAPSYDEVTNSPEWLELIKKYGPTVAQVIIGGAGAYEAYQNSQKANELLNEGLNMAREDYASRQPYRDAGMLGMLDPRTPDLSSLFANSGNPYAKGRVVPVVGNRIPASATLPPLSSSGAPSPPTQPVTQPFGITPGASGPTGTPDLPTGGVVLNPRPRDPSRAIASVGRFA